MTFRIETDGLTLKEVRELQLVLREVAGVEDARFMPFLFDSDVNGRSLLRLQASAAEILHLIFRVGEGAALGIGVEASKHLYRRVGEGAVDKVWAAVASKLSGKSSVNVAVTLYGPDDEIIKDLRGRR